MMKIKKILSASLALLLTLQCSSITSLASEKIPVNKFEEVYKLTYNGTSEYGYADYRFVDENGNTKNLEPTAFQTDEVNMFATNDVPVAYSLLNSDRVTSVKNQGYSSSCWAFTTLGCLESNAISQGLGTAENTDFSEAHLVWFAQNSATTDTSSPVYGDGINKSDAYKRTGNWLYAVSCLSRWSGTVKESDYPFYSYELSKMGNYAENDRYNTSGGVIINSAEALYTLSDVKNWLMQNGAVEINIHYDDAYMSTKNGKFSYYCNDSTLAANHALLVVGWDDSYSSSNFNSSSAPSGSGAFLCRNSWAKNWGNDGYFWLSYADKSITQLMGYTCVSSDTYNNNYTYNGLGYSAAYKCPNTTGSQIANVFTSKGYETLSAVSTYTAKANTYAEIFIYKNLPSNYSKPNQGTRAYSSSKILLSNPGYHTISIKTPLNLSPDEIFSVVIRFSTDGDELVVQGECNPDSGEIIYSSKPKQSFIDLSGTNSNWYDSLSYGWNNNCIQAFTTCIHQPYEVTTPPTCENDGAAVSYCSQCSEQLSTRTIASSGHAFGEWENRRSPTPNFEGEKSRTCEVCHSTETQPIPRLPQYSGRRVTTNEFMEILKIWFDNFIARITERYDKKGFRSY